MEKLERRLFNAKDEYLFRHSLVSSGYPKIDRFNLRVEPPWRDFEEDECLSIELTSAGVLPIVKRAQGDGWRVLMVKVIDEGQRVRWELPSGSVKPEDMDIKETAVREFQEETGLEIDREELVPLTYARHGNRGGIQFMIARKGLELEPHEVDTANRSYFIPPDSAFTEEVGGLVLEPVDVFLSLEKSLLRYSQHPWASTGLRGSLRKKLSILRR